jgi:hypothetical protein
MTDQATAPAATDKAPKDRSPSFPFIGLPTAIERLVAFEEKFGRHPTPANKVGLAWEMKEASSQAGQTLAALKSFGMVDYAGSGPARLSSLTEDGRNFLRAQQDSVKREYIRKFALTPKVIASYWSSWGAKRPIDEVCLDELVLKAKFTQSAAETFLRVYDATIAFAGLTDSDNVQDADGVEEELVIPPDQDVAVGDLVCVESGGQIVFEKTRVRAIDAPWVFVEASQAGVQMSDVTLLEKARPVGAKSLVPPVLPFSPNSLADVSVAADEEMDRFTVDEGVVKIVFPSGMTVDSVDELEQFFTLFIKKAKRRAGAGKKAD